MIGTDCFHKKFRLNGNSFNSVAELLDFTGKNLPSWYPFMLQWFNESSFVKVKTSGSTGVPKEIQLKKRHMLNSAKATGNFFNLGPEASALLCMSTDFIAGKMMLVRALVLGWRLDVIAPSSCPLKDIEKSYHFCAMVPMQVQNSLDKLNFIDTLIVGGGAVQKELRNALQGNLCQVYETYGMTETITHVAIKPLNSGGRGAVMGELFVTLPNVSIVTDSRGCLVISAPDISDSRVITNDMVKIVSENSFKWLGRIDNVVNSGGLKLIPEEIEKKLRPMIDFDFFVAGLPDDLLGEKLVLVMECHSVPEKLWDQLKRTENLTRYERPKEVYGLKNFIRTKSGKIRRKDSLRLL